MICKEWRRFITKSKMDLSATQVRRFVTKKTANFSSSKRHTCVTERLTPVQTFYTRRNEQSRTVRKECILPARKLPPASIDDQH